MNRSEVTRAFEDNVQELAEQLISAFGLKHKQPSGTSLDDPLLRWVDFRLRSIEPKARQIVKSNRFPAQLPAAALKALGEMEQRIVSGVDLNPYLSKTVVKNDTSANVTQRRTDGMWADWGIHHLHLSEKPAGAHQRFAVRSGWLLFVMVYENAIAFIDVRSHDESDLWTQEEMVKTFIDSWPEQADRFRINGVLASGEVHTPEEIANLRNAGINRFITHAGSTYMGMGQGVTSAATSTKVTLQCNKVRSNVRRLAEWAADPSGPIMTDLAAAGVNQPQLSIALHPESASLMFYEKSSNTGWLFKRGLETADGMVHDALLPPWAVQRLLGHLAESQ